MCKVYFPIKIHVDSFVEKIESYLQVKKFLCGKLSYQHVINRLSTRGCEYLMSSFRKKNLM